MSKNQATSELPLPHDKVSATPAKEIGPPVRKERFLRKPDNMTFVITVALSVLFAALGIIGAVPMGMLVSAVLTAWTAPSE
ncbi:MAG: hypothetical protein ACREAM_17935 [Blastocatellia bacterium]